jgi:uncharacterized protein DUF4388
MALQGNLDDFSLPEILQLIAVQQKSGVLKLTAGDDVAVIFFEGGKVVSTRDRRRNAKDPLKPFLVKTGRLTDPQLRQVETIESESRRELTDILLSGNYLTGEQLTKTIEEQVQDTLHQLLTWKTGAYHFSGDARTVPKFAVNVRLNTEGLLMESMRRIDEFARYKEELSSPAMVLRPKALASPPATMTEAERRVLPLVDGLRPLRDILAQSKLVDFEVYEALHHLLELGVIEVSLSAAPPKVTPMPTATAPRAAQTRGGLALAIGLRSPSRRASDSTALRRSSPPWSARPRRPRGRPPTLAASTTPPGSTWRSKRTGRCAGSTRWSSRRSCARIWCLRIS